MMQSTTTKRLLALGLGACLVVSLSACGSSQTSQVTDAAPTVTPAGSCILDSTLPNMTAQPCASAEALDAYRGALLEQNEFVLGVWSADVAYYEGLDLEETPEIIRVRSTSLNEYMDEWADINTSLTRDDFRYFAFSFCDLDGDGEIEIILDMSVSSNRYVGRMILHYEEGAVYGYELSYRGFSCLKMDGTFERSSGADDYGSAEISFEGDTYSIRDITYCESSNGEDGERHVSYYVDGEAATEDSFDAAIQEQGKKPEVEWFDYTDDVVERVFSDFLH